MPISRKNAIRSLLASLFTLPAWASRPVVKRTEVEEFLESNERSRRYTLAVFNQMPEAQMGFKPSPEMFTFQRHFTHCIEFVAGQLTVRLGMKDPWAGMQWDKLDKAQTAAELTKMYDWIATTVKNATPDQLAKTGDFAGDQVDLLRLLYICENHLIHHRGTVMVYLRLCKIVPGGYVGW